MSDNGGVALQQASANIMDIISRQEEKTRITVLMELLKIYDIPVTIAGDKTTISNIELITEYPNVNYTKTMTKNETWRASVRQVFQLADIDEEQIIGHMDYQFMLKMVSHKRKRAQEIINGLKNEIAGSEVIPEKKKTKAFFGLR